MARQFVHLHLHTHYSILDGVCQVAPLLDRARELDMNQLAITDHGNMYGAVEFFTKAQDHGIKPILGMEAYVAPGGRADKVTKMKGKRATHVTLLARNNVGYRNLCALSTRGFTEGFHYNPRIDKELMREHADGLICLSGCLSSELSQHILHNDPEGADAVAREYMDIFGRENFYFEIMNNKGIADQVPVLEGTVDLSRRLDVPLVGTSDVHYILPEHSRVQEILICINTGKKLADEKRMKFDSSDFFLKSPEQMWEAFSGYESACENTLQVAERCHVDLAEYMQENHLPTIEPPAGKTVAGYLEELSREGLRGRYGSPLPTAVEERFQKELGIIVEMGFPSYFLMVWDLVNFARSNDIAVGPGRGSAAGSILAYALGITNIDPLKYNLLFERFLNKGRNEMPDIDLDFDKERRQEVIDYLVKRHGQANCAQIVTFGCLSAKSGVRDVGRVMDIPLKDVDVISKQIPDMMKASKGLNSIQVAMKTNSELQKIYDSGLPDSEVSKEQIQELLDAAGALDGVVRQTGIHASGILVTDKPILEYGPMARPKVNGDLTTQYEMKMLDKLKLCKVDVLGLETLTLLKHAVENIRISTGKVIDIDAVPLDDAETFALFSRGDTKGVFQCESEGFRELLIKLKPDRFEDVIAVVAMYRPGPLGTGMVDTYINCKHGREEVSYLHPNMEPILKETFGLILYQEQVQALAFVLASFSLSEGDMMRRAMGKKDPTIMAKYRSRFVDSSKSVIGEKVAEKIFDQIDYFAGYGFNKSHSACYAYIAYQTAYLKCHYPKEYMAALLTINRGDTAKVVLYKLDAAKMDIEVLMPNVNTSGAFFLVDGDKIQYGMAAIKGVGDKAVLGLVEERKREGAFKDLYDFCARIDSRLLNKGALEALIKAGALDVLGGHRAQLVEGLEGALAAGHAAQRDRASGQMDIFGGMSEEIKPRLPKVPEWEDKEKAKKEKEVLGFSFSFDPIAANIDAIERFATASTGVLAKAEDRAKVIVGGVIAEVQLRTDKNQNRYAQLRLEDSEGSVNVMVFRKQFAAAQEWLIEDEVVFVEGGVDNSRQEPTLIADRVIPLHIAEEHLSRSAILKLDSVGLDAEIFPRLKTVLAEHAGRVPLYICIKAHNRLYVTVQSNERYFVQPSEALQTKVCEMLGDGHLRFGGKVEGRLTNGS